MTTSRTIVFACLLVDKIANWLIRHNKTLSYYAQATFGERKRLHSSGGNADTHAAESESEGELQRKRETLVGHISSG